MYNFQKIPDGLHVEARANPAIGSFASATSRRARVIRAFDVVIAASALLICMPLMAFIALLVKASDGGPVLFWHSRIGRGGVAFRCLKFRSMVIDADARLAALLASDPAARHEWDADQKLRKDPRITLLGRFLRASSLDELPQLFNVLIGEMSIVGPRPIVAAEVSHYGRWYVRYCSVRPGITGIWQVSGRNNVSYRKRVAMDVLYSRESCVLLYIRLLLFTIPAVLLRRGAY